MDDEHCSPCQKSTKAHFASPLFWTGLDRFEVSTVQQKVSSPCQETELSIRKQNRKTQPFH